MTVTYGAMFAREDGDNRGTAKVIGYVAFRATGSKKAATGYTTEVIGEVEEFTIAGYMKARVTAEAAEAREVG